MTKLSITTCHHWIENNSVYCRDTGLIIGGGPYGGPLIIGRVGTRLALKLLWQSVRGWRPPKDGSRAVGSTFASRTTGTGNVAVGPGAMHAGSR